MSDIILARDLRAGDFIKAPDVDGLAAFHSVPTKRTATFIAHYAHPKSFTDHEVTYEPDDEIQVFHRWPEGWPVAVT